MTEYQVGSLGSLISGIIDDSSRTRIVFEKKVTPKLEPKTVLKRSADRSFINLSKGSSTFHIKGETFKNRVAGALLKERKPEIAGDQDFGAVGTSWRHLPSRNDEIDGAHSWTETSFSDNAAKRVSMKKINQINTQRNVDDPETEARTIFVGNIPFAQAKAHIVTKLFSEFGEIERLRFRCIPLKDPRVSKKVAFIKREFHPDRSSICAYVVFKTPEEANAALEMNGTVFHGHHLRVDLSGNSSKQNFDAKKSIFVGNLPFAAEEEDLWELFSSCGKISSVRIVRDPATAVSKGIAFVNFESADSAELALQLDESVVRKRAINVTRYKSSAKSKAERMPQEKTKRHKGAKPSDNEKERQKSQEEKRKAKKEKRDMRRRIEKEQGIIKKRKRTDDEEDEQSQPYGKPQKHKRFASSEFNDEKSNKSNGNANPDLNKAHEKKPNKKKLKKMKLKKTHEATEEPSDVKHENIKTEPSEVTQKKTKHFRFQGQTVEDAKKKKKKINKGEMKKKKIASVLGAGLRKKKKIAQ